MFEGARLQPCHKTAALQGALAPEVRLKTAKGSSPLRQSPQPNPQQPHNHRHQKHTNHIPASDPSPRKIRQHKRCHQQHSIHRLLPILIRRQHRQPNQANAPHTQPICSRHNNSTSFSASTHSRSIHVRQTKTQSPQNPLRTLRLNFAHFAFCFSLTPPQPKHHQLPSAPAPVRASTTHHQSRTHNRLHCQAS
jgi:hypothetical protein